MELKAGQRKVLQHLKNGRSVFGLMPTGYGKSRCFQEPAFRWGWKVIVVSPLISLMEDQVIALKEESEVFSLHSGMSKARVFQTNEALLDGNWRILYISPERLCLWHENGFLERIDFRLLAIDEAHCVDTWSNFRTAYGKIGAITQKLKRRGILLLALTATLPAARGRALMREWAGRGRTVAMPLGRENLGTYLIACEEYGEKFLALTSVLSRIRANDSVLIYCASRERTEELCDVLGAMGFPAVSYHAGLPSAVRSSRVASFRSGLLPVVCATSAFGMGIDYGNVRAVVHFDCPDSIENYWQEAGRAGRSSVKAASLVLWTRSDLLRIRAMEEGRKKKALEFLFFLLAEGCRKRALEAHFGMRYRSPCGGCNFCRTVPEFLTGIAPLLERQVWWLSPEARPEVWIPKFLGYIPTLHDCRGGGTGRHTGLKILGP